MIMANFIKGIIVAVVVLLALLGVNVICNIMKFEINQVILGTLAAIVGMTLYARLTGKKNEQ